MDCKTCLLRDLLDLSGDKDVTITRHASKDKPLDDSTGLVINIHVTRNYAVVNKTTVPDDPDAPVNDSTLGNE